MKKYNNFDEELNRFKNHKHIKSTNPSGRNIILSIIDSLKSIKNRYPKEKLPEIIPDFDQLKKDDDLRFIWFGHSSILLRINKLSVFFDPVIMSSASPFSFVCRRFQKSVVGLAEIPTPDVVVLSHNHHDHYDKKVVEHYAKKEVHFFVPLRVGEYLKRHGVKESFIHELNWGEVEHFKGVKFHCTEALHSSGRWINDQNKSLWSSWVVAGKDYKIFFSGDTGYSSHFKDIGEQFGSIDLAFVENGQYDKKWPHAHMFPNETVMALRDLNAKCFVPIHWGMFALAYHPWFESVEKSYEIIKNESKDYYYPQLGEVVGLRDKGRSSAWWRN